MVNGAAAMLEPTFTGYVATTQDAVLLFEACLTGDLHHVPRRPYDRVCVCSVTSDIPAPQAAAAVNGLQDLHLNMP
ncbi:Global transcription regulator sge1 [Penicillium canescens]|nr:Global transcription regulator sge1 [Penicillium canescens]